MNEALANRLEQIIEDYHPEIDSALSKYAQTKKWFIAFFFLTVLILVFTVALHFFANESQPKADIIWVGKTCSALFVTISATLFFFADINKTRAKRILFKAQIAGISDEEKIYFISRY